MSERGSGVGPFLLGVVIGALVGVMYAPARGDVTRRRIGRRVGDLKDLAEEKLEALSAGGDEDEEGEEAEEEEPSTREELEQRLRDARRRRRADRSARSRAVPAEEDDEPVA